MTIHVTDNEDIVFANVVDMSQVDKIASLFYYQEVVSLKLFIAGYKRSDIKFIPGDTDDEVVSSGLLDDLYYNSPWIIFRKDMDFKHK